MSRAQMILFLRHRPAFVDSTAAVTLLGHMPTDELRRLVDGARMLDTLEQSRAVSQDSVLPVRCEVCDAVMHPDAVLLDPTVSAADVDWAEWTCLRCCETGVYEWSPEAIGIFVKKLPELRKQVARAVNRDA